MRNNKNTILLLIIFAMLLSPIFLISSVHSVEIQERDNLKSSQMLSFPIKVAIYDEDNTTRPSYTGVGSLNNEFSYIHTALLAAGYTVTNLTTNQIYNHELSTANYDVLILVDQCPKVNISNFVTEFWLGGGSILSIDSALSYICWAGILPPESTGDDGYATYWSYPVSSTHNITTRHPVSRSYAVNDTFDTYSADFATFDWSALHLTSIASELVKIATISGNANFATVVGYDPQSRGGKVVHISTPRELEDDAILIDAVEWLCPRPKARVLFDLSHLPYYGIDAWDDVASSIQYGNWRNTLVSRGYTLDKLYPSAAGNLTTNNLDPYDMLFLCIPAINFTSSEVAVVTNWVSEGGGVIAIGEQTSFLDQNNNINYLYSNYDLKMDTVGGTSGATYFVEHPIIEGCSEIEAIGPGVINYTGEAFPICGYDATNIYVAGQEYGNGRILLMSDVAAFRNGNIGNVDNEQFAINTANWLTTSEADVLIYVDEPDSPNYYRTPVANALNELDIEFFLTADDYYLNLSLNLNDWDLVIVDNPWSSFDASVFTTLADYVDGGGRLIMSTFRVSIVPTHTLWAELGFEFDLAQPGGSSLYIWDATHAIFNEPVDYGAVRFDPIRDYGDEGDLLRVLPGAISLGGYTASESENNTNIVLANGGKTLYNGYLIDQFTGDLDDSTYADNFELWTNEIAFMWAQLQPVPSSPGIPGYDIFIVFGSIFLTMGLIAIITIRKKRIY